MQIVTKSIIAITLMANLAIGADRFSRDDAKEIVTDNKTRLQWQDDSEAKTIEKTWQGAIEHCEALDLGGYDDWRLPNVNELESLIDYGRYDPAMDPIFKNVNSPDYSWSSTTAGYNAWIVNFYIGTSSHSYRKSSSYRVRCVR